MKISDILQNKIEVACHKRSITKMHGKCHRKCGDYRDFTGQPDTKTTSVVRGSKFIQIVQSNSLLRE